MKTARDCALVLTVFTLATGMRYVTDVEYSHHVDTGVARLLRLDLPIEAAHGSGPGQTYALMRFRNNRQWHQQPSPRVLADYAMALNPLPGDARLAYAANHSESFTSTVNTFSLWIPQGDSPL